MDRYADIFYLIVVLAKFAHRLQKFNIVYTIIKPDWTYTTPLYQKDRTVMEVSIEGDSNDATAFRQYLATELEHIAGIGSRDEVLLTRCMEMVSVKVRDKTTRAAF